MDGDSLPGLRGTDHLGFTVPDMAEAHSFITEILGGRFFYSMGPFASDDDRMSRQFNVSPQAVIREVRFYRLGSGANLEIFEYESIQGQRDQPRNSDVGGHHIALYVDDFDEALTYLKAKNVKILGQPQLSTGPGLGQQWIYFLAPWGMQFELVSYPNGKAYLARGGPELWNPTRPQS
jgi:glyoxylase I family protein